uniref:Uncharacterized protein n=1 Tax=Glossina pallidipes TaxID=7398 RepID=A0A1B0AIN7_GLOPL
MTFCDIDTEGFNTIIDFRMDADASILFINKETHTLNHCNADASLGLPSDFDEDFHSEEDLCDITFGDLAFGSELIYKYNNDDFVLRQQCYEEKHGNQWYNKENVVVPFHVFKKNKEETATAECVGAEKIKRVAFDFSGKTFIVANVVVVLGVSFWKVGVAIGKH